MSSKIKKRCWSIIGYPESIHKDWIQILTETGLKVAISPLHDKDIKITQEDFEEDPNNKAGKFKKAHWHIMLIWKNPTTYENVMTVAESINCRLIKPVESPVGMYWYHIHRFEKDPKKPLYNNDDRILLNGCSEDDFIDLDEDDRFVLKEFISDLIEKYNIFSPLKLKSMIKKKYFDENGEEIESDNGYTYKQVMNFVYNNGYFCKMYMDDVYNRLRREKELESMENIERLAKAISEREMEEEEWKKMMN